MSIAAQRVRVVLMDLVRRANGTIGVSELCEEVSRRTAMPEPFVLDEMRAMALDGLLTHDGTGTVTLPEPTALDRAMHAVWMHSRYQTVKMTTEEREAAADAVQRVADYMAIKDGVPLRDLLALRWWK